MRMSWSRKELTLLRKTVTQADTKDTSKAASWVCRMGDRKVGWGTRSDGFGPSGRWL